MGGATPDLADELKRIVQEAAAQQMTAAMSQAGGADGAAGAGMDRALLSRGGESRVVSIEDGTGNANGVRVNGDNNLGVEARYANDAVVQTVTAVGTTSVELVATTAGRVQFTIQNTHDTNDLYVRLGGTATTADLWLGPGEMYSLPPGASYDGSIFAIASAVGTGAVLIEYKLP